MPARAYQAGAVQHHRGWTTRHRLRPDRLHAPGPAPVDRAHLHRHPDAVVHRGWRLLQMRHIVLKVGRYREEYQAVYRNRATKHTVVIRWS